MARATVLVVEDEIIVAERIREKLEDLGYIVPAIVASGEQAIQKTLELRPDLVLMDIKLDGNIDGIEAAEKIRAQSNTPVVYLTAFADDHYLQRAKVTEPYGYVLKPFQVRELHTNIEMALYRHRIESERKQTETGLETYARQQAALLQISANLAATLDETEVCQEVIRGLHEALGYDYVGLFLVDEATGERVLRAIVGWPNIPVGWRIPPGQGLSERPLLDGQLHYTPDVLREQAYVSGLDEQPSPGSRSEVDVPLRVGDKVLGALVVESKEPDAFDQGDFALLTAAANQASVAIERARKHQAVREAETRYRSLVEGVPVGIYRSTPTGKILDANPALVQMLGYPDRESLLAVDASDLYLDEEQRQQWQATIEREEDTYDCEVQLHRYDGTIIWAVNSAQAIRDQDGQVLHYEGTLRDITEYKKAEENERRLQNRLQRQRETIAHLISHPALVEGYLEQALVAITEAVAKALDVERVNIWQLSPDRRELRNLEAFEHSSGEHSSGHTLQAERYPRYFAALETGLTMDATDARTDPRMAELTTDYWTPLGINSTIEAPIRLHGQVVGVVCHEHEGPSRIWTPDEVAFASQVADLVAQALMDADVRNRAERLAVINRIAIAASAILNLEDLLETVYQEITSIFEADAFFIALYDDAVDELVFRLQVDEGVHEPPDRQPLGTGLTSTVVTEKRPLLIQNYEEEQTQILDRSPQLWGTMKIAASWLGVPMQIGDRLTGVICVQAYRPYAYGEEEQLLLSTIAEQVAVAIENARLYEAVAQELTERRRAEEALRQSEEALQRRNRELALLNQAGQAFNATLDLDDVLGTILEEVRRLLDVVAVSVWLKEPDTGDLICQQAIGPQSDIVRGWRLAPEEGIVGWVASSGESLIVPDIRADERHFGGVDQETGIPLRSILSVPLRFEEDVIGVLQVTDTMIDRFSPVDLALLEPLAASAASAIHNAEMVEALRQQNAELDAFAGTVAHDLKNPLGPIVGFAELLKEDHAAMSAESLRHYLNTIAQKGRKMSNIIDELLLLASVRKVEDVKVEPLDMAHIVAEAQSRLSHEIQQSQAQIILPEAWPSALGYGPWIEEVWVNYISNAIKYGGRPPHIELGFDKTTSQQTGEAAKQRTGTESHIRFWVRDDGPGLSPDDWARLFTPFTRLNRIQAKGHGLGLSIVQRIVERLGGQVGVESEVGQGSAFSFTLPGADAR